MEGSCSHGSAVFILQRTHLECRDSTLGEKEVVGMRLIQVKLFLLCKRSVWNAGSQVFKRDKPRGFAHSEN